MGYVLFDAGFVLRYQFNENASFLFDFFALVAALGLFVVLVKEFVVEFVWSHWSVCI